MRKFCFRLLFLTFLFVSTTGPLPAQRFSAGPDAEVCVIVHKGQNRNRTVAGHINEECGSPVTFLGAIRVRHSPPWGNWGVSSNYASKRDTDQFKGWKLKGGKKQWNSCTTEEPEYAAPNRNFYNANNFTTQASPDVVTHGTLYIRTSATPCHPHRIPVQPGFYTGCSAGPVGQKFTGHTSNFMTIYELDKPDRDDLIETLYFPGTSVVLTDCTYEGCPEKTTDWVQMTRDTSRDAVVEAELRMKARAYLEGDCSSDWDW